MEELANLFYDEFLIFKEKNEVMALLERYKHEKIILMSASVDPVINVIAKNLNVEAVSSKLEFIDNKSTGLLEYNLTGIKHLQVNNPVSLIVTDNFSDINLIKLADTAVIISKAKDKNKWRVLLNRFGVSKDKVRFM
ncbi:putative wfdB [Escherichia coli P0302293.9]|uniref:WfdB n=1 Tax=Shigella boydii 4444-74 TaxID=766140 RepID=I6E0K3_SHIBO|nr:wfdB [Shigella boydii]EGK3933849.1 wfdB [Escherichia coli]EIQ37545.1 wfdB [Shigella boydii 4444-74]EMX13422.1 putative wfdB [Escherichia coli P0302293.2]END98711.1 putative wfdB [Escherichia coli P0302293.7]ENE22242.1 putative wfdB [Escherichia coli P0302293.3]ENE29560.1 putative wfdB [Escherichia coli P0302293.4]ENE35782.1 putative wfdB [Escherichia coli P0302293.6]ENE41529.1 putative wfdB [Escherichia coli P0302293.8]ENE51668.1 putative wfdB [Escherichia coli P0302293.9]ODG86601.1 wf